MGSITSGGRRSRSSMGGWMVSPASGEVLSKHVRNHCSGEQLTCPIQQLYALGVFLTHELSVECDFN